MSETERMRIDHFAARSGENDEPQEPELDELQQRLAETYAHIRRSNDTAAIRRVNQGTRDLLNSLGFKP